jgi:molybdopterin-binding protein
MRISAHNVMKGKMIGVEKSATTAHVRIENAPGQVLAASIVNQSVEDVRLEVDKDRHAVLKVRT